MCRYTDPPHSMIDSKDSTGAIPSDTPTQSFSCLPPIQTRWQEMPWHGINNPDSPDVAPCCKSCEAKHTQLWHRLNEVLEDNARMTALLEDARLEIKRLLCEKKDHLRRLDGHPSVSTSNSGKVLLSPSSSSLLKIPIVPSVSAGNFMTNKAKSSHGCSPIPSHSTLSLGSLLVSNAHTSNSITKPGSQSAYRKADNIIELSVYSLSANEGRVTGPVSRDTLAKHTTAHTNTLVGGSRQKCTLPSLRRYMPKDQLDVTPSLDIAGGFRSFTCIYTDHCSQTRDSEGLYTLDKGGHGSHGGISSYSSSHKKQQVCQPYSQSSQPSAFKNTHSSNSSIEIADHPPKKRRKRHHDIASKVRSVQPVPKDKSGNYEMPVQVGILTVLCLGQVVWNHDAYHNERYIWPVGYTVQREYHSMKNPNKNVIYTCCITDGGDTPLFHVEAEDMPGSPIVAPTATGAWTAVLRIVNQIRRREHSNSASGPDYFGFSHPTIAKMIQDLPGVKKCKTYIMQNFVEMKERHVRGVVKKGRGGRPSLEMLTRGQRALMAVSSTSALSSMKPFNG